MEPPATDRMIERRVPVSPPAAGPHRRYNPLLDEWVLCSPQRLDRPWLGLTEPATESSPPPYDPACYLCPGNVRANGERNPDYTQTFVFENDFPALVRNPEEAAEPAPSLLTARPVTGVCRVVCFSPRHDLSLARMDVTDIEMVVRTWMDELERLETHRAIQYVQLFENRGALMGCSNPHPHCQIWATGHVPTIPTRKRFTQSRYWDAHGTDLLGDYLRQELAAGARLVCGNDHWVALVPFWAAWPFEVLLLPRRLVSRLTDLRDEERGALANILHRLHVRYDNVFDTPFPYSMGWHGQPADGLDHPYWRLHAVYFPPLLRSAHVRKFVVGYELTAEPQRDLTPEEAAGRLREASEQHYLERCRP